MEKQKGGKRENSGAKPKYDKPTVMVSFRCPENKVDDFKKSVKKILSYYEVVFSNPEKIIKSQEHQKNVPVFQDNYQFQNNCDCKLDENGLLRRGKMLCKKSKSQHDF